MIDRYNATFPVFFGENKAKFPGPSLKFLNLLKIALDH